jgi:hypothetical protein
MRLAYLVSQPNVNIVADQLDHLTLSEASVCCQSTELVFQLSIVVSDVDNARPDHSPSFSYPLFPSKPALGLWSPSQRRKVAQQEACTVGGILLLE